MTWPVEEAQEVTTLKKKALGLETLLTNERNLVASLTTQLEEARSASKTDLFRRHEEEARAVDAEESLRKKIEQYKQLQVQKGNSDSALSKCETKLNDANKEIKKLEYAVEVVNSRAAGPAPATAKLVQEKAALERKVQQLTDTLSRTEAELVEAKAASTSSAGADGSEPQPTPTSDAKSSSPKIEATPVQDENRTLKTKT
ncbi:hypothetical protein P7C70_g8784, partial [Phenoliferia sp. Uapishka_3]